ncbi:tyrosine-type recombinase/integrase [Noviherbaspirillum pedocola]|uniref:Tyrosine-type recombinase/integrase n=1 Tax=Noviherbaspirillum pedocola TaxID=2801341 RepID=A0A934W7F8_9BURK|nr:tyrosine-type recombinase/integrase [Noviherbaspirillum pedocola]MBK4734634.1 tyrosine-type recombinase/integrase [Noviherbaspirillum pedocola]
MSKDSEEPAVDLLGDPLPEMSPPGRQNVKRGRAATVDEHERSHRDFLTEGETARLLTAAKAGRYGARDYCMLLLMYRHGLRVSELTGARRADIDLDAGRIWVKRNKDGLSTNQPLQGDELRALRAYLRMRKDYLPWLFLSSQGGQMTRQNVNYLIQQAGVRASLGHVHPHMLRHTCGHVLANKGTDTRLLQDWLGHRDIRHTAWYTRTSSKRFEGVWQD